MKKHLLPLALAVLALTAPRADAALLINIYNSGTNVISSFSGTINNLPTGTFYQGVGGNAIQSGQKLLAWAPLPQTGYMQYSLLSAPYFGAGGIWFADAGTTGNANLYINSTSLVVGPNYVEGSSINASSTYSSATINSLGLIAGTYYYTWGNGVTTDSATLVISETPPGPAAVPEPGTWAAAAMLLGGAGFARWRKRAKVA